MSTIVNFVVVRIITYIRTMTLLVASDACTNAKNFDIRHHYNYATWLYVIINSDDDDGHYC